MNNKSPTIRSATYEEIACWLGISRQAVGNKMHGTSEFTLNEVLKLYEAYGVTIWELKDIVDEATETFKRRKDNGLWQRRK